MFTLLFQHFHERCTRASKLLSFESKRMGLISLLKALFLKTVKKPPSVSSLNISAMYDLRFSAQELKEENPATMVVEALGIRLCVLTQLKLIS